jgi:two-component system, response regulator YesN
MWKVLIADDEPKIRRGLRTTIQSLRNDLVIVAEAEDGQAALSLAQRERPDILLVDIRMPFLSGLELIERLGAVRRDCVIIVVSGHDEFDYAQKALHLGVFEYVLKPATRDTLGAVLARATEELEARKRESQYLSWAREQLDRQMPVLREQFLRDCAAGRLSRTEIEEQLVFLGLEVGANAGIVAVHVAERLLGQEEDRQLTVLAVKKLLEEALSDFRPLWVFSGDRLEVLALGHAAPGVGWAEAPARIEGRARQSLARALIVAWRPLRGGIESLAEVYDEAMADIAAAVHHGSFVLLAQNYVEAHIGDPDLSLEEVAESVEISPGHLSRLFKQETGHSFVDYLTRVRVARAVHLMSDPAMKIYQVAESVGYQSQHYFSRAFKRVLGRPPVELRKGSPT